MQHVTPDLPELPGPRIRRSRSILGLTQEDLAAALGVSRFSVIRWENGDHVPGEEHRQRLAEVLGGTPNDYLRGTGDGESRGDRERTLADWQRRIEAVEADFERLRATVEHQEAVTASRIAALEAGYRVLSEVAVRLLRVEEPLPEDDLERLAAAAARASEKRQTGRDLMELMREALNADEETSRSRTRRRDAPA